MTSHLLIMAVSGAAAASAAPTFSDHLLLNDVLLRIVEAVMVYYPTLVLIDKNKKIAYIDSGEVPESKLAAAIGKVVGS